MRNFNWPRIDTENRKDLGLATTIFVAYVLLHLVFGRHEQWAWDMFTYGSFARFLSENWFYTVMPDQAMGLQMLSYPPLLFQTMALLVKIPFLNMTAVYITMMSSGATLLGFTSFFFLDSMADINNYRRYIIAAIAFSPGLLKFSLVHGQLTFIWGISLALSSAALLYRTLEGENYGPEIILTTVLTAYIHHFSLLLLGILVLLITVLNSRKALSRTGYLGPVYMISTGLVVLGLLPTLQEIVFGVSQGVIPHASRHPLKSLKSFNLMLTSTYGFTLAALPLVLIKRRYRNLRVLTVFMMVLGLGLATPLPGIIFQDFSQIMVYDRFSFLASLILAGLFMSYIMDRLNSYNSSIRFALVALVILSGLTGTLWANNLFYNAPTGYGFTTAHDTKAAIDFLEKNASEDYLYVTRGHGPGLWKIQRETGLPTLDTAHYSGRKIDVLKSVGTLDKTKIPEFRKILGEADRLSLRYVISFEEETDLLMDQTSWKEEKIKEGVTAWINTDAEKYEKDLGEKNYIYGAAPPIISLLLLLTIFHPGLRSYIDRRLELLENRFREDSRLENTRKKLVEHLPRK